MSELLAQFQHYRQQWPDEHDTTHFEAFLEEGPRVQSILLGGPGDFEIGMELEIDLETLRETPEGDEIVIYRYRPVTA